MRPFPIVIGRRAIAAASLGANALGALMFAAMFLTFLAQIVMRYLVGEPLGWTIEMCGILYVAIVFWGAAFMARERDHIVFSLVRDVVSPRVRRLLGLIAAVVLIAAFATALPGTVDYVAFMAGKSTPVMRVSYLTVYGLFPVFMVATILRYGAWTVGALGRGPAADRAQG